METKANYVAVGAFTVLVFAAAFAFVFWVARVDTGGETAQLNIVIEGSVTGLGNGSFVKFNGIDVGRINRLRFDADDPGIVIAEAQVRRDLPITEATSAVLSFTGLTGVAHIEMEGGDARQPNVFALAEEAGVTATITADPSAVNDLLATAQDIANRADNILNEFEEFVSDARAPLTQALHDVTQVTGALAANADGVDAFLGGMGELGGSLETLAVALEQTLEGVDGLLAAIDPDEIDAIVGDVRTFTGNLSQTSEEFEAVVGSARQTLAGLEGVGDRVNSAFDQVDALVAAVDPEAVGNAVSGFADAGQSARQITQDVAELTAALEGREADIEAIFANVTEMSERLNAAAMRVDGVLARVDGFFGAGDAGSVLTDVGDTLRSFRDVADNLNARLNAIGSDLEQFSDRGLRDVQSLVNDTRRSITRIEQAITSLERDPQRLLFGGDDGVKRFDGRQRR